MSLESVKQQFAAEFPELRVIETEQSSATVELAAAALGVEPGRIAKTMSFHLKDQDVLILAKGTARIDNRKFKDCFHCKAKMLAPEEVVEITGHPVGGVCPFGMKQPLPVYLDISLREYDVVYPAGGSPNSAVAIAVDRLAAVTKGTWVDVCG